MLSREQKSTESVESYLSDLYKLFGNSNYYTEEQKSAIFIKGLKPNLKDFVIQSSPKTLLEAVQNAKLKESLLEENKNNRVDVDTLNILSKIQEKSDINDIKNSIKVMNDSFAKFTQELSLIIQDLYSKYSHLC